MTDDVPPFKDREGILPGNATPLESAIADTDGRLDDIDADLVRRIGGPDIEAVPAPYLSRRAWARSVDVWRPTWPEATQRRVIEVAPRVHARKGSRYAVRAAVAALGVKATFTEWWQTTPRGVPYTFEILAFVNERGAPGQPLITPELTSDVLSSVMAAKPLSRAFALSFGVATTAWAGVATAAAAALVTTPFSRVRPPTTPAVAIGAATVATVVQVPMMRGRAAPPIRPALALGAATAISAIQMIRIRTEASPS